MRMQPATKSAARSSLCILRRMILNVMGEVIEDYPDDSRGHSCLLLGEGEGHRPIHVACAPKPDYLPIFTEYIRSHGEWDASYRQRRSWGLLFGLGQAEAKQRVQPLDQALAVAVQEAVVSDAAEACSAEVGWALGDGAGMTRTPPGTRRRRPPSWTTALATSTSYPHQSSRESRARRPPSSSGDRISESRQRRRSAAPEPRRGRSWVGYSGLGCRRNAPVGSRCPAEARPPDSGSPGGGCIGATVPSGRGPDFQRQ